MTSYLSGAMRLKQENYTGINGGANTTVRGLGFYFGIGFNAAAGRASALLGAGAT